MLPDILFFMCGVDDGRRYEEVCYAVERNCGGRHGGADMNLCVLEK
jgi:hypothetical protein